MSRAEKVIRMGMGVQVCELNLFTNIIIVMGICPKCMSTNWALGFMDNLVIQRVSNKPYQHPSYTFWLIVIVLIMIWHGWHNAYYWEFSYFWPPSVHVIKTNTVKHPQCWHVTVSVLGILGVEGEHPIKRQKSVQMFTNIQIRTKCLQTFVREHSIKS